MASYQKTVVVLGGAKSIGGQCARSFISAGWSCFIADTFPKTLESLKDELGDRLGQYCGDLTTRLGLRNVMAGTLEAFGSVDAVIHIPDLPSAYNLLDSSHEDFEESLIAPARCVTSAIRMFSEQMLTQRDPTGPIGPSDSFVQVFGMAARAGDPGKYSQTASQSMALAAAEATALELAPHNIRTNAIVAVRPRAENEEPWLKFRTPSGRHSHAEEVAEAALFLCGSGAANMTGQSIIMDGGRSRLNGVIEKDA